MRKLLLAALAALSLAAPAHADQILGQGRIDNANRVILPGGPTLGRWQGNKYTSTPDALQIQGPGSTGAVPGMTAPPDAAAAQGTLAKQFWHAMRGTTFLIAPFLTDLTCQTAQTNNVITALALAPAGARVVWPVGCVLLDGTIANNGQTW